MRFLLIGIAYLILPLMAAAEESKLADDKNEKVESAQPDKPEVRTLRAKSGSLQFVVHLRPGVPDPGKVVEAEIEMADIPPIPDPIYGERIPVKGVHLIAKVTDADGAGYTLAYRVHALQDAGQYGFHFTPIRKDNYRLALTGSYKGVPFNASLKVPVGIWPLPAEEAAQNQTASRLPALPGGMRAPASPGAKSSSPKQVESALHAAMERMGESFSLMGEALYQGRRADLKKAKPIAVELSKAIRQGVEASGPDPVYPAWMQETLDAAQALEQSIGSGKRKAALRDFGALGGQHCNRCHLKLRWQLDGGA